MWTERRLAVERVGMDDDAVILRGGGNAMGERGRDGRKHHDEGAPATRWYKKKTNWLLSKAQSDLRHARINQQSSFITAP